MRLERGGPGAEKLKNIQDSLTDAEVRKIVTQAKALAKSQEQEENFDLLPKVALHDVAREGKEFSLIDEKIDEMTLFCHTCFTNEIVYTDLIFDLPYIAEEELPYLRLFSLFLPQVGCGGRDYKAHLDYLLEHTGGVSAFSDLALQAHDPSAMKPHFTIQAKALRRKVDKLFPLLSDMVKSADFTDENRLAELLMQHVSSLEAGIQHNSLRYAVNLAASALNVPGAIINKWYGLPYYWKMKKELENFAENPKELIAKLQALQNKCLGLKNAHLVLSCDEPTYKQLRQENFYGLPLVAKKSYTPWKADYKVETIEAQGRISVSPVAFTVSLFPSVKYTDPASPLLQVASEIMENKTLHKRIREQGGAYGSGASLNSLMGYFYFYSYRDPHLASTLAAFEEAAKMIADGLFDEREIEEAKLGIFQELDSPIPPSSRAMTAYSRLRGGRTKELRQQIGTAIRADEEEHF